MPTSAADTEITYIGNGVTIAFPFPFEISKASHFEATIDGAVVTAYTLSGLGVDAGGTCSFTDPPASLAEIVLARVAPYARTDFDYQEGGELAANTLDEDVDRTVQLSQQLATTLKRVPKVKRGDLTKSLDLVPEASKLLAWDASAAGLVNVDVTDVSPSSVVTTSYGQSLMTAADKDAARDLLGIRGLPQDIVGGRLNLGNSVPWENNPGPSATVYYVPYNGSQIGLNNGGTWFLYDILAAGVAPSLSVAALTDNRLFDIFAYPYNGTQIALEGVSWTSDTLRAVTLTVIDGIPTKSGDNTRRYLGTARKRGGIVYCSGNYKFVELWNMYNRVPVPFEITYPTATWAIAASATWRQADANASNQVNFCIGYRWGNFTAHARSRALNSTATARKIFTGIGIDSITVATNKICTPGHCTNAIAGVAMADAHGDFNFNAGQHYLAWLERGDGVETQTFQGSNGDESNGMIGEIWA